MYLNVWPIVFYTTVSVLKNAVRIKKISCSSLQRTYSHDVYPKVIVFVFAKIIKTIFKLFLKIECNNKNHLKQSGGGAVSYGP